MLAGASGASAQKVEYVFPSAPFNEAEVAQQMEEGTATISGIAKIKKKGVEYIPWQGERIDLFPATPYLLEFVALQKKYKRGRKVASMSNDVFTYRIAGRIVNDKGGFEFRNLKPGKYYIVTWITYEKERSYQVRTGTETAYNAYGQSLWSTPIYANYTEKYTLDGEVSGIVEVTGEGQKVTAVISN